MEHLKTIARHFEGDYSLMDYHPSHSRLLLRHSSFVDGENVNTDVVFNGVFYMDIPTRIEDFYLQNGDENDRKYLLRRMPQLAGNGNDRYVHLYKITANGLHYYIACLILQISTNTLDALTTSFPAP